MNELKQEINNLKAHIARLVESEAQLTRDRDDAAALVMEFTE